MDDRELNEEYCNKYGPAEVNKPFMVSIPISSIWNWFKKRKQNKELGYGKGKDVGVVNSDGNGETC